MDSRSTNTNRRTDKTWWPSAGTHEHIWFNLYRSCLGNI